MTLPIPRLRAIRPGESFTLVGETRARTLINTDRHYGHFENGKASLCHALAHVGLVWAAGGWQVEVRKENVEETAAALD